MICTDMIFCMEKKQVRRIRGKYSDIIADKIVICPYITDNYDFMDQKLQELLKGQVNVYIS